MIRRLRSLFCLSALAIAGVTAGCSGGDSMTGPAAGTNVGGNWTYAAPNMTGTLSGGITVVCSFSSVAVSLSQTGSTFSGSTTGGSFTCSAGGVSDGGTFGRRIVVNGEISGSGVEFDFDGPDWHHTGQVSGNSMTGQATAIIETGSGSVVLRGSWSAARN